MMQTDVLASTPLTATGAVLDAATNAIGRARVKAAYIIPSGTAGSVVLRNNGASGTVIATLNTVASATQPTYLLFPGEGLLFSTNVHGTVTNVGSITLFYA